MLRQYSTCDSVTDLSSFWSACGRSAGYAGGDSGYEVFFSEEFDNDFEEDWDEDSDWDFDLDDDFTDIDEDELISYMNEFFLINGDLPEPEAY